MYDRIIGYTAKYRDVNWAFPSRPVLDRCRFVIGRDMVGLFRAECGPESSYPIMYRIFYRPSRTVPRDIGYYTIYFFLHKQT